MLQKERNDIKVKFIMKISFTKQSKLKNGNFFLKVMKGRQVNNGNTFLIVVQTKFIKNPLKSMNIDSSKTNSFSLK